ncbi:MAG: hypothetical protein JRJ38_16460 [Deltaproteobacteria bacterium]|nr:hypothetical protein [Deltaproteobacteria bacterium]
MTAYLAGHPTDRRRTTRFRRFALMHHNLDTIDRPIIKTAETRDELEQAFSLVYREYLRSDYITKPNGSRICATIYHVLPETAVFTCTFFHTVVGTFTYILDGKLFGLPMDALYHKELNALRDANRRLVEISSLAISRENRGRNVFMQLFRAVYWYAIFRNVNDLCIMVNPKHVEFYKTICLFEDLGPEKYYPKVGAPAVALRLDLDEFESNLRREYDAFDFDCDLYSFFFRETHTPMAKCNGKHHLEKRRILDANTVKYFFIEKTNVLENATPHQMNYIRSIYQGLN